MNFIDKTMLIDIHKMTILPFETTRILDVFSLFVQQGNVMQTYVHLLSLDPMITWQAVLQCRGGHGLMDRRLPCTAGAVLIWRRGRGSLEPSVVKISEMMRKYRNLEPCGCSSNHLQASLGWSWWAKRSRGKWIMGIRWYQYQRQHWHHHPHPHLHPTISDLDHDSFFW